MLTQLTINNFAIVHELEIDFQAGMTAITGETGAGKSIAVDALGLCLGNRSEAAMVRHGAARADICARFSLQDTPLAFTWLEDNQLDDNQECLLRRVISADGRSRGFINGTAVPISQLRELGQLLIQIHGQHAHQLLLKPEHQKRLLDAFVDKNDLLGRMKAAYQQWHASCNQLLQFQQQSLDREARSQLLQYQLKELNEFMPQEGEYEQLDAEYRRLANSGQLLSISQQTLQLLSDNDDNNILSLLNGAQQQISELVSLDDQFANLATMLDEASIQIHEASDELRHYAERMEIDPTRQYEVEQRLSRQLALARKHHVRPEELPVIHQQLLDEHHVITQQEDDYSSLTELVAEHHQQALNIAHELHLQRSSFAKELAKLVVDSIHKLSMPNGQFSIEVSYQPEHLNAEGADKVEFLVTTNPGQPLQPLYKVASGGELSRIALAIQVITAQKMDTPALIFDEVDTGISGPTAAIVGKMLRQLGHSTQVITVTHLPQVAGNAHQHFYVAKQSKKQQTHTSMQSLNQDGRLKELARLLGGDKITDNTLANAKELLIIG
jgi:DNA repair protein RecN (Recombination protein N)